MIALAFVGALLIGISLGLLGSGGSILTVPVLIYLLGQDEKVAIAGSLGIVGIVSLIGAVPYARRREIAWTKVLWFGVPGMIGTWVGAWLSSYVSGAVQLALFAVVMLLAAVLMLRSAKAKPDASLVPRATWVVAIDGLLVGVITGLVGVGGGFLIVPALVLLGGMPMRLAIGTSLMIIAAKSSSGFVKYLAVLEQQGKALDWSVVAIVAGVASVGTIVGGRLNQRLPQVVLRRVFGALLVVMAAFILCRTLGASGG